MDSRRRFLKLIGLSWLYPLSKKENQKKGKEVYLFDFYIAGFQYYEGVGIINLLKPGDELILKREPKNEHDEMAVALHTKDGKKLGYIPMESNLVPKNILDSDIEMKAVIKEVNPDADTWEMVYVGVSEVV